MGLGFRMICSINITFDIKTWKSNSGYGHLWLLLMWLHLHRHKMNDIDSSRCTMV